MATGANNQTMFVDITLEFLATGAIHDESGEPVCVVNVTEGPVNPSDFS